MNTLDHNLAGPGAYTQLRRIVLRHKANHPKQQLDIWLSEDDWEFIIHTVSPGDLQPDRNGEIWFYGAKLRRRKAMESIKESIEFAQGKLHGLERLEHLANVVKDVQLFISPAWFREQMCKGIAEVRAEISAADVKAPGPMDENRSDYIDAMIDRANKAADREYDRVTVPGGRHFGGMSESRRWVQWLDKTLVFEWMEENPLLVEAYRQSLEWIERVKKEEQDETSRFHKVAWQARISWEHVGNLALAMAMTRGLRFEKTPGEDAEQPYRTL